MLLDDIIAILSDEKGSLNDAMLKTKVLLHQIGHKELVPWVTNELGGYPEDVELPPYRHVVSQPHGHVVALGQEDSDFLLPTGHLTDDQRKTVQLIKIGSAIGTIQDQAKTYREKQQGLMIRWPPEMAHEFQKGLRPGVNILKLWCEINMADFETILVQVRSRLLDFCLQLQGVVGVNAPPQQLQEKAASVDTPAMFYTAINVAAGGSVVIGSHNFQVNNQQGDIEALIEVIAKLGFQQAELDGLRKALIEDEASGKVPDVTDGETGKWYTNALKEAGKGVVKVGVDVVAATIVQGMKSYLG
jgi:hypothetical protein